MDTVSQRIAYSSLSPEMRELEKQSFEIAFETLLEHLSEGRTFESFCNEYHTPLHVGRFRAWVFSRQKRREAYYVAKAIGAEAIEDELIRISDGIDADGNPSADDVGRATLRINTRKWLLQISNRKRYGDVKQIESHTTTSFDPSSLSTMQLQQRILQSLGMEENPLLDYVDSPETVDDDQPSL